MVTEWVFDVFVSLAAFVGSWFVVEWEVAPFFVNFDSTINDVLDNLSGVGAWVDWGITFTVVGAVVLAWIVGLGVKLVRQIAAHLPVIGGSG